MVWRLIIQSRIRFIFKNLSKRYDLIFFFMSLLLSVGVLTCTLMLFEGYERALKDSILNFNAHIYFFKPGLYDLQNSDIERIEKYLKEQQEYVSSQAVINGQGMLSIGSSLKGVNYRSIDDKRTDLPVSYREIIAEGTHLLEQENDIVIGKELANTYDIALNDTIFILSGADQRTSFSSLQQLPLRVVGTFKTGMYEYDMKNIFVSQGESQKLTKRKSGMNEYNLIEVRIKTEDIEKAREIALKWEKEFHFRYQVFSWIHYNGNIFSLIKLEKWVIGIVLFFLIIIASFSTISSTITSINEDKKKIAILRAIGLKYQSVYKIYFTKFLLMGIAGIISGIIGGWFVAKLISKQSFIKMEGQVYLLDAFHVDISFLTLLIIFTTATIVVSVSIYAALKRLKMLDIIDILRMNK